MFLYPAYALVIAFVVKIIIEVYPTENYKSYIKDLPKEANGRFSEYPLFLMVLYVSIIIIVVMGIFFTIYVLNKRSILKKRVLKAFGKGAESLK